MTEVVLQRTGIVAIVGDFVSGRHAGACAGSLCGGLGPSAPRIRPTCVLNHQGLVALCYFV